jgi:cytochrome b6-f complex iron-sulfur subunit
MSTAVAREGRTRRGFLEVLLGLAATGSLATVVYPILRYLTPLPSAGPAGPAKLSPEDTAALERQHFVIVSVAGTRVLVFRGVDQQIRALDARCTHEGCTVQYVPGESVVWCACHNARFDVDGRVLSGPPPRPLSVYTVQRGDDGSVVIVTSET